MSPGRRSGPALLPRTASDEVAATVQPIVQAVAPTHQNGSETPDAELDAWGVPWGQAGDHEVSQQPSFFEGYRSGIAAGIRIGWRQGMPAGREQLFNHLLQCFLATPTRTYSASDVFELLGERRQAAVLTGVADRAREAWWRTEELYRQRRADAGLEVAEADRYREALDARAALDATTPARVRGLAVNLQTAYAGADLTAADRSIEPNESNGCDGSSAEQRWSSLPDDDALRWRAVAMQVAR